MSNSNSKLPGEDNGKNSLPTTSVGPTAFSLEIYLLRTDNGDVVGRVANFECDPFTGNSEPSVLRELVKRCRIAIAANPADAAWISPSLPIADGEQRRIVPMHL